MAAIERRARPLLGTFVEIQLTEGCPAIFAAAFAEIERIQQRMSAHCMDSDLGQIAREGHRRWINVDPATTEVIQLSLRLAELSEGAFDPVHAGCALIHAGRRPCLADHLPDPAATWQDIQIENGKIHTSRPLAIDLGGIAKGYAVDRAAEIIIAQDGAGIVNAGGDLRFIGTVERAVSLRKPNTAGALMDLREIPFPALATTASYAFSAEGGNLDLVGRKLPTAGISITVFAKNCALADAMTKVVLNLPVAEATSLLRKFKCSALILTADGGHHELS